MKIKTPALKIGFVGQGYIGKNYADNFEMRGFDVVRYSLEPQHAINKKRLKECDVVFIAVPTPTTLEGADISIVSSALSLLGPGATAVIKSTIPPGTTVKLQSEHKKIRVFHSPEFLTSATARTDADMPSRNIIGIPVDSPENKKRAAMIISVLPKAPFELIVSSAESEFIKYCVNTFYYAKVVYMNILYDVAKELGMEWDQIKRALAADPWIGPMHIEPIHKTGRGAGGHCLIKDYAAFLKLSKDILKGYPQHLGVLKAIERDNLKLLHSTGKDPEILKKVYSKRGSHRV